MPAPRTTARPRRASATPRGWRIVHPDIGLPLPPVTAAQRKRAAALHAALRARYPDARCALRFSAPHELLIATILSAQSTDVGVNKATPALFARFHTPRDYAEASPEEIEPFVKSCGFFRMKARAIHESMREVVERFGGEVPRTMGDLLTLRGVARKTANVVLGNAFGVNMGFVVDTHIERLAKRMGLAPAGANPAMVERHLMARFPRAAWTDLSHMLIAHGRAVCRARGARCADDAICRGFCSNARAGAPRPKPKRVARAS